MSSPNAMPHPDYNANYFEVDQEALLAESHSRLSGMGLGAEAHSLVEYTDAQGTLHVGSVAQAAAVCPPFMQQISKFSEMAGPDFAKQALSTMRASEQNSARYEREGSFTLPAHPSRQS